MLFRSITRQGTSSRAPNHGSEHLTASSPETVSTSRRTQLVAFRRLGRWLSAWSPVLRFSWVSGWRSPRTLMARPSTRTGIDATVKGNSAPPAIGSRRGYRPGMAKRLAIAQRQLHVPTCGLKNLCNQLPHQGSHPAIPTGPMTTHRFRPDDPQVNGAVATYEAASSPRQEILNDYGGPVSQSDPCRRFEVTRRADRSCRRAR